MSTSHNQVSEQNPEHPVPLTRYAWLSIAAAMVTIVLKSAAYVLTGSVGLLSDALESTVNLAAAIVALIALRIVVRPANDEFTFGYSKVEYFASGFEGGMILLAAAGIIITAIPRLIHPVPLEQLGLGLVISVVASLINLGVALVLMRAGKRYNSITLEADARHLMTDVWTTVGVLVGIALVWLTGFDAAGPDHRPAGGRQHPVYRLPAARPLGPGSAGCGSAARRSWPRSSRSWILTRSRVCGTTPCARGRRRPANSWSCTCWFRGNGRSAGLTAWPNRSKSRYAKPSRIRTSSRTSSRLMTPSRSRMPILTDRSAKAAGLD